LIVTGIQTCALPIWLRLPSRRTEHSIDYFGAVLLGGGVAALILLTTWGGNQYAWSSSTIVGLGVVGVLLLAAFVWQERRAVEPRSEERRVGTGGRAR